jgi:hypothetical protein
MDSSLMSLPQFSHMNTPSIPQELQTTFNATMVQSQLPKVLAYSSAPQGNVMLYESNKTTLLLVLPPGLSITIGNGVRITDTPLPIPGGIFKTGYVFYKNNQEQLLELDKILGTNWREQLSEPLPAPIVKKEPVLLARNTISYNGHIFPASLWEYSDKSLVVFAPMDFSGGNDKLMKPWKGFVCPDSPSGKSDGWMIYKGTQNMINFAKTHFPVPFDTMYTKSQPVVQAPIIEKREPIVIETKAFMFNEQQVTMEFVELSPLAIALFPSPMIQLEGFDLKELFHPTGGKRPGYLLAKSMKDKISDLESMYTMVEEAPVRANVIQQASGVLPNMVQGQIQGKGFSDLSINSFDDIPISTLLRLIKNKLKVSTGVVNKNEISGQVLIYGDEEKVTADAAFLDEMEINIQIKCENKSAILLVPVGV